LNFGDRVETDTGIVPGTVVITTEVLVVDTTQIKLLLLHLVASILFVPQVFIPVVLMSA
tara:strand:- start:213 stop:389 length:177 start_codon:yes stop_codon:yes gene_type:complete